MASVNVNAHIHASDRIAISRLPSFETVIVNVGSDVTLFVRERADLERLRDELDAFLIGDAQAEAA